MPGHDAECDDRGLMPVFDLAQNHFDIFADRQPDFACNRDRRRRDLIAPSAEARSWDFRSIVTFLDLARKFERHVVVKVHRRACVLADFETFLGKADRHRPFDPSFRDLLAIDRNAPRDAGAIIDESRWSRIIGRVDRSRDESRLTR
jgi:hypothetical protein